MYFGEVLIYLYIMLKYIVCCIWHFFVVTMPTGLPCTVCPHPHLVKRTIVHIGNLTFVMKYKGPYGERI